MGVLYGVGSFDQSNFNLDGAYILDNIRKEWPGTEFHFGSQTFNIAILSWSISSSHSEWTLECSFYNKIDHLSLDKHHTPENYNFAALWFRKVVPPEHRLFFYDDSGWAVVELLPETTSEDLMANYWKRKIELADWESVIKPDKDKITQNDYPLSKLPTAQPLTKIWQDTKGLIRNISANTPQAVFCSPDNTKLLIISGNTLEIQDTFSGQVLKSITTAGSISCVTPSPSGKLIITAGYVPNSNAGVMQMWEMATGKLVKDFGFFEHSIKNIQFSPDDSAFLTYHNDVTAGWWETETGRLIRTFGRPTCTGGGTIIGSSFKAVQLSPDGKTVAVASIPGVIYLWNTEDGQLRCTITNSETPRAHFDFSTDMSKGQFVIGSGYERMSAMAFSPDSTKLAVSWIDNIIRVYEVNSGRKLSSLGNSGRDAYVGALSFSPDGRKLLLGLRDVNARTALPQEWNLAQLWEIRTGKLLATFRGHSDGITCLAFSPDPPGSLVVTGSHDGITRLWEGETGNLIATYALENANDWVREVGFSNNGKLVLINSWNNSSLWEVGKGGAWSTLEGHESYISAAAFSPDGNYFVTGSWDTTARVWELSNRKVQMIYKGHQTLRTRQIWSGQGGIVDETEAVFLGPVLAVAISPTGEFAVSGSWDGTARLWSLKDSRTLAVLDCEGSPVRSVSFSPDGTRILVGCEDGIARIWESSTGSLVHTLSGHLGYVTAVAFSPDGRFILTGSQHLTTCLWESGSGRLIARLEPGSALEEEPNSNYVAQGADGWVRSLAFSSDSTFVAVGGDDRVVRLWRLTPNQVKLAAVLTKHQGIITGLSFNPFSPTLLSWDNEGELRSWKLPIDNSQLDYSLERIYKADHPLKAIYWKNRGEAFLIGAGGPRNLPYLYQIS